MPLKAATDDDANEGEDDDDEEEEDEEPVELGRVNKKGDVEGTAAGAGIVSGPEEEAAAAPVGDPPPGKEGGLSPSK
jgi:hypothetical protein